MKGLATLVGLLGVTLLTTTATLADSVGIDPYAYSSFNDLNGNIIENRGTLLFGKEENTTLDAIFTEGRVSGFRISGTDKNENPFMFQKGGTYVICPNSETNEVPVDFLTQNEYFVKDVFVGAEIIEFVSQRDFRTYSLVTQGNGTHHLYQFIPNGFDGKDEIKHWQGEELNLIEFPLIIQEGLAHKLTAIYESRNSEWEGDQRRLITTDGEVMVIAQQFPGGTGYVAIDIFTGNNVVVTPDGTMTIGDTVFPTALGEVDVINLASACLRYTRSPDAFTDREMFSINGCRDLTYNTTMTNLAATSEATGGLRMFQCD